MKIAVCEALGDFHAHSTLSDGSHTPHALMGAAIRAGFQYFVITDHHTAKGFDSCMKASEVASEAGLMVIPGVEISTKGPVKLHLLGHGMNKRKQMDAELSSVTRNHEMENINIVLKLEREQGIALGRHFLANALNSGYLTKELIAEELSRLGYAKNAKSAYEKYLGENGLITSTNFRQTGKESVHLIDVCGGVATVAHLWSAQHRKGGKLLRFEEQDAVLHEYKGYGVKGLEMPRNENKKMLEDFELHAENHGLIRVYGSDFHGNRPNEVLGSRHCKQSEVDRLLSAIQTANNLANGK